MAMFGGRFPMAATGGCSVLRTSARCRAYSGLALVTASHRSPHARCTTTLGCPSSAITTSLVSGRFASSSSPPPPSPSTAVTLTDWFFDWRKEKAEQQAERARFRKFAFNDLVSSGPGDVVQYSALKGKPLEAPNEAFPAKTAFKFPISRGHDCFNRRVRLREMIKDEVCVVVVTFRELSWDVVPNYMDHLKAHCGDDLKGIKLINIYGFEKPVYHLIKPLMKYFMRRKTPKDRRADTVFLTRRSTLHFRFMIRMTNCIPPWVLLVDHAGRVRWRAVGKPLARELHAMTNILDDLLEDAKPKAKTAPTGKLSRASLAREL